MQRLHYDRLLSTLELPQDNRGEGMHPDLNGFSVVLVGSWNRSIFSPAWIKSQLGIQSEIGIEFAVGHPSTPTRLVFDNIALLVNDNRLVVSLLSFGNGWHSKLEGICTRILETLCHTPISAMGVNFRFVEPNPGRELLNFFEGPDKNLLSDGSAIVSSSIIQRNINYSGFSIHFKSINDESGIVVFDFNFHNDVSTAQETQGALSNKIEKMYSAAEYLTKLYPGVNLGEPNELE